MTLQLNIRSVVYCPAPKLASPSLGGWSSSWFCSPGITRCFPSLVMVSLVIFSPSLATYSVPRFSDIVHSLFIPPLYLSVQRGCRPFQATCLFSLLLLLPFSSGGLSSLSLEDRLVCSMEPSMSSSLLYMSPQFPANLTSSAIHPCP